MARPTSTFLATFAPLALFALAFVAVSYAVHTYKGLLQDLMQADGAGGMLLFVVLTVVFVVFVIPLDIVFLIPIGTALWGPLPTALMSITGWTLGSAIAFGIARSFGAPVVGRLIGLERIRAIETRIPKHNLFWTVVFLRLTVGVDILSYALGLFSTMAWGPYVFATALGVAPFGFYFAYAGTLPFWYQILAIAGAVGLASILLFKYGLRREP